MAANWYYIKDGTKLGPIEAATLKQLAHNGVLQPDDLVWKQGAKRWGKASSIQGLFSAVTTTSDDDMEALAAHAIVDPQATHSTSGIDLTSSNTAATKETDQFIDRLFDLSFRSFVTTQVIPTIYTLAIIASVIIGLILLFGAFAAVLSGMFFSGVLLVGASLAVAILGILFSRVGCEMIIVIFRIAENTDRMANRTEPPE